MNEVMFVTGGELLQFLPISSVSVSAILYSILKVKSLMIPF